MGTTWKDNMFQWKNIMKKKNGPKQKMYCYSMQNHSNLKINITCKSNYRAPLNDLHSSFANYPWSQLSLQQMEIHTSCNEKYYHREIYIYIYNIGPYFHF